MKGRTSGTTDGACAHTSHRVEFRRLRLGVSDAETTHNTASLKTTEILTPYSLGCESRGKALFATRRIESASYDLITARNCGRWKAHDLIPHIGAADKKLTI